MPSGRKSLKEELQIKQRYADLTEPYFKVLKKHLESGNVLNEKWAVEQLTKAYTKMIPQTLAGDSDNPIAHAITGINYIVPNGDNSSTHLQTASSVSSS